MLIVRRYHNALRIASNAQQATVFDPFMPNTGAFDPFMSTSNTAAFDPFEPSPAPTLSFPQAQQPQSAQQDLLDMDFLLSAPTSNKRNVASVIIASRN